MEADLAVCAAAAEAFFSAVVCAGVGVDGAVVFVDERDPSGVVERRCHGGIVETTV